MENKEQDDAVSAWIQKHLGPVTHIERQKRWRPSWLVTALVNGQAKPLYVRGGRGGTWPPLPLSYEAEVFKLFERNGVRVPHVYGYIESVPAIVMDLVEGRPGLDSADEGYGDSLRTELMEQMALIHAVDPRDMAAAGAPFIDDPRELGVAYYRGVEALFTTGRDFPAPAVEFLRRWLNRHVPENPEGGRTVAVDAAQYVHNGRRLTAMLDFELAAIGDIHCDLAALRIRNLAEYIGDVNQLLRQYALITGTKLDYNRIRFHTAAIALLTPMQIAREIHQPRPQIEYHEYRVWNAFCMRWAIEAICELIGRPLPTFIRPEARPGRYQQSFKALQTSLEARSDELEIVQYAKRKQRIALRFLERCDSYQAELEARHWDNIEALTGRRSRSPVDADLDLEHFIATAPPEHDGALLDLFYSQYQGECFLIEDEEDHLNFKQIKATIAPVNE